MTSDRTNRTGSYDAAKAAAMRALQEGIPQAQSDPGRPEYHFLAPARWMNDINGPLHYKGQYHIFYQHNPFGDKPYNEHVRDRIQWASKYWGHARSADLVAWEHLPIALAPSTDKGEMSCWSGCATVDENGKPMIFYTALFENELPYKVPFEQWAAFGDEDLIKWEKSPANPVLAMQTHGRPEFSPEWRDPFIFRAEGRTFMIVGACGPAGTPIYEVEDGGLERWTYRGIMWDRSVECPNFVPLGDKWVFISSPFDAVDYAVGSFDTGTLKFAPEAEGVVDGGNFYGTNTLIDDRGRCILFGWVPGWEWDAFRDGRGWNGCMSLPRVLSLDSTLRLVQRPVPELKRLRVADSHFHESDIAVENSSRVFGEARGGKLEVVAEFATGSARAYGLNIRRSPGGEDFVSICYEKEENIIDVAGAKVALPDEPGGENLKLHVFLDKSVIEVFVNDGAAVATRMIYPARDDLDVELFARDGGVRAQSVDTWQMSSVTPKFAY